MKNFSYYWHYSRTLLAAFMLLGGLLWLLTGQSKALAQATVDTYCRPYPSPHQRFGFNFSTDEGQPISQYHVAALSAGWYLDYRFAFTPTAPSGLTYLPMVRAASWRSRNFTATLQVAVQANPGRLWVVGNEPDRDGQDGLRPEEFAAFYHAAYSVIKGADARSRVAIGGVVQPTPLRLRYLAMTLAAYTALTGQRLPTDAWTVHGFILPENASWGASVPPGLEAYTAEGKTYKSTEHDNLTIFGENLIAFRRWLAEQGYRNKPLLLTEYGILLPAQVGNVAIYPHARVRSFMLGSFDFLLNAQDAATGYPADDNRLVQAWSWFSLNHPPYDAQTRAGFNGNLFDPATFQLLPLGQDYAAYTAPLVQQNTDLAVTELRVEPPTRTVTATTPVSVVLTLVNGGSVAAQNVEVKLWLGDPNNGGTQIGTSGPISQVVAGCQQSIQVTLSWQPPPTAGAYQLYAQVQPLSPTANDPLELNTANNSQAYLFLVLDNPLTPQSYLPLLQR